MRMHALGATGHDGLSKQALAGLVGGFGAALILLCGYGAYRYALRQNKLSKLPSVEMTSDEDSSCVAELDFADIKNSKHGNGEDVVLGVGAFGKASFKTWTLLLNISCV